MDVPNLSLVKAIGGVSHKCLPLGAARARAGIRVLILTVAEDNGPAVHLYESLGFRAFGLEPMALATENGFKAILHMWLPLGGL